MTTQEFSIEFDILYNNLASNAAPPLNEYEKSVFLTKAQSDIVLELYSGRNNLGLAFESSEEVRRYLSSLEHKEKSKASFAPTSEEGDKPILGEWKVDFPEEVWFVTREEFKEIQVIPITQDEYWKIKDNPFRGAKKGKRVLRIGQILLQNEYATPSDPWDRESNSFDYYYYGLKKPTPIILPDENYTADLTIDGKSLSDYVDLDPQEIDIHPSLHRMILDRAVLLAKQAYIGGQTQA